MLSKMRLWIIRDFGMLMGVLAGAFYYTEKEGPRGGESLSQLWDLASPADAFNGFSGACLQNLLIKTFIGETVRIGI